MYFGVIVTVAVAVEFSELSSKVTSELGISISKNADPASSLVMPFEVIPDDNNATVFSPKLVLIVSLSLDKRVTPKEISSFVEGLKMRGFVAGPLKTIWQPVETSPVLGMAFKEGAVLWKVSRYVVVLAM